MKTSYKHSITANLLYQKQLQQKINNYVHYVKSSSKGSMIFKRKWQKKEPHHPTLQNKTGPSKQST